MEDVLYIAAIALFVVAALLAVVAVALFVRTGVLDAIRFLQGKRVPTKAAKGTRHPARRVGRAGAEGGQNPDAKTAARRPSPFERAGDDFSTDVVEAGPDDTETSIVEPLYDLAHKDRDTQSTKEVITRGRSTGPVDSGDLRLPDDLASETPTELLTAEDGEDERGTGLLVEGEDDAEDVAETPTGLLVEDEGARPGPAEPGDADEAERPTGVLVEGTDETERPTGILAAEEEAEDTERATGLFAAEDEEADEAERATGLLSDEVEVSTGVAQQSEPDFTFRVKQNIIVVHAADTL